MSPPATLIPLTLLLALAACGNPPDADAAAPAAPPTADTGAQKGQDPMLFGKKSSGLLEVGSKAPDFAVPDHEGHVVKLSDLAGNRVLLWFYPKADTPG